MHKDPTEFRKRFAKWKEGGKPYKDGKISDEQYVSIMENVAADNWQQWGDESEDAALTRILNDNAYDYRGYYNDNPGSAANADTHWPDKYKTVWHPTFSNQSKYSGKKSQYNPHGYPGGTWQGELFNPQWYQQHYGTGFYKDGYPKLPKFEGGEEKFKKLRDRNWDTSGPVDVERTDNTIVQRQEPAVPIKRKMAKGVVPQSWVERRQNEQPVIQQGKNYTQRRIEEETKRTWLSDAADIARGAGEGAMFASNFVPFAGEMFSGGRALMNNLRSYLLHPNYKTVYHGSPYPFDIKNAWTATPNDIGLHVAENKATADIMKEHGGVVYKLRIPKEDTQTIDLGKNGANHLSEFFHMKAAPKEEYYNFYDTSPGDDFRINVIRNAGGDPSINETSTHLYLENPVDINLRKLVFPNIKMKDQVEADNILRSYNALHNAYTGRPLNFKMVRQYNQQASDLLSRNGYKVIKYHNANPFEGGGTAYMITDSSVMDVIQKVPTGSYPGFLGSFGGYGTNKLIQTMKSE